MPVYGKCHCGKKATTEWLAIFKDYATSIVFCDKCSPKVEKRNFMKIYGKNSLKH